MSNHASVEGDRLRHFEQLVVSESDQLQSRSADLSIRVRSSLRARVLRLQTISTGSRNNYELMTSARLLQRRHRGAGQGKLRVASSGAKLWITREKSRELEAAIAVASRKSRATPHSRGEGHAAGFARGSITMPNSIAAPATTLSPRRPTRPGRPSHRHSPLPARRTLFGSYVPALEPRRCPVAAALGTVPIPAQRANAWLLPAAASWVKTEPSGATVKVGGLQPQISPSLDKDLKWGRMT